MRADKDHAIRPCDGVLQCFRHGGFYPGERALIEAPVFEHPDDMIAIFRRVLL